MGRFDRGVSHYTVAMVPIRFPEDEVNCRYCPLRQMRLVDGKAAVICGSTGEIIKDVDNPGGCPAIIQEDDNGERENLSGHDGRNG